MHHVARVNVHKQKGKNMLWKLNIDKQIKELELRHNPVIIRVNKMARNCGHEDEFFLNEVHKRGRADWYLDAKEAKKFKIANHLRLPKLEINVDVNFKFA